MGHSAQPLLMQTEVAHASVWEAASLRMLQGPADIGHHGVCTRRLYVIACNVCQMPDIVEWLHDASSCARCMVHAAPGSVSEGMKLRK